MDLTDIALENEKLKKDKHFLDKLRPTKNTAGGTSADSKRQLNRFLPSKQDEYRTAEKLARVFNTTTRAGAGGTRAGTVGIRPSGGRAASEFLENYTGTGRLGKPKPKAFSENQLFEGKSNNNVKKPSVVIYDRCMDCLKPVSQEDCVPNMTIVPPANILNPIVKAKWQAVRIQPGDIVCYLFCGPCVRTAVQDMNKPGIPLIINGQETTSTKLLMDKRGQRISDQVFEYIKNERIKPESNIFYGDCKDAN